MKKIILHIAQSDGGVSKYLQMLFKYFNRNEYEQILVCSKQYAKEENIYRKLVDKIEFVDMTREINLKLDIKAIYILCKIIKKYNPDLIYVHSSKAGALGRIANFYTRKSIIYNPHGWAFNMNVSKKKKLFYELIERILAKKTDKIVAISNAEKQSAIKHKICINDKVKVIFNGIDISEYENNLIKSSDKELLNIPENTIVIGMVGRISRQKAPDTFVRIAAKIKKIIRNAFFIIVGDGDEKEEIEELIRVFGLQDSFLITGWVNDVYTYIKRFDIAMLISRWEGFGLVIPEYMVSKKPIIATNVDAIPNLITNNNEGILINVDNVEEGVNAILKIVSDNNLVDLITKNAYCKVKKEFDVKRVAKEHENLIDSIL
ncbi:glycosyltransferase family 4 protein [Clostridium sp. SHJSY1]|uniref:glycosyltransferase family 4 protein n=1 Tax=Clostridium sp. SHJSY1 TaxID=2942483 RepID=UPI00287489BC|nr:glycosyltransferase family 4 protein [Clostridium sp. SHJSY1]MDS0526656.1 glycosyltransferase family 4 protein [Clostridium sp. SHJSY1]